MRASEFITEGEMHDWHKAGIPGMKSLGSVGQYYELYRFGVAMAAVGAVGDKMIGSPQGVTEDDPTTMSYTQADEDIVNGALKALGKTAKQITDRQSAEPKDTNTQSPFQSRGPIKRKS